MKPVEIKQVIVTNLTKRGDGKNTPIRDIVQYWDMQGNLLFEIDEFKDYKEV